MKTLAFVVPPPNYVYVNVPFEADVKVIEDKTNKVISKSIELQVVVRYHDTYDVLEDQKALLSTSPATTDPKTGTCKLMLVLNTLSASCDSRPFCIEVRTIEQGIESIISSPIYVVKEKLTITEQPPDIWFKDEGGREKCMTVTLQMEAAPGEEIENRVVPLDLKLLYECGTTVLNQGILRTFPDMRPNMKQGHASIAFRIDDVSKNHQGQSFVLEFSPEKQSSSSMFQDIAPVRTTVIAIRSKRNKRKLNTQQTPTHNQQYQNKYLAKGPSPRSVARTGHHAIPVMVNPMHNGNVVHPAHGGVGYAGQMSHPYHPQAMTHASMQNTMPPSQRRKLNDSGRTVQNHALLHTTTPGGTAVQPRLMMYSRQGYVQNDGYAMGWNSTVSTPQQQGMPPVQATISPAGIPTQARPIMHNGEWQILGFECYPSSGGQNTTRPIYQCSGCKRLCTVDMVNTGMAEHTPSCPSISYNNMNNGNSFSDANTYRQNPPQSYVSASHQDMSDAMGLTHFAAASEEHQKFHTNSPETRQYQPEHSSPLKNEQYHQINNAAQYELQNTDEISQAAPQEDFAQPRNSVDARYFEAVGADMFDDGGAPRHSLGGPTTFEDVENGSVFQDFTTFEVQNDLEAVGASDENQVFYILARMYATHYQQKSGMPAFDQNQHLIGFYCEAQDSGATHVVFHSIFDSGVTENEQDDIINKFKNELDDGSGAVHTLTKYQNNYVRLKEDALMYCWSQTLGSMVN